MTRWFDDMAAVFDLETTGVDVVNDRIVSSCVALARPGQAPVVEAEIVNPGIPIPQGAIEVHGIGNAMVQAIGNPAPEAVGRVAGQLADMVKAKIPIMGMNLAYDLTLLHWECRRYGLPTVEEVAGRPLAPVIDALVLDKQVHPYRKGKRKLVDLAAFYGVTLEGAHDSTADALAAGEVCRVIGRRYPEIGEMSPLRLHLAQVDWRAEQCASLQAYFRKTDHSVSIDPCWPYCPDPTHPR